MNELEQLYKENLLKEKELKELKQLEKRTELLTQKIELAEDTINNIEYQFGSAIPYRMMIGRIKLIVNNYNQNKKAWTQ